MRNGLSLERSFIRAPAVTSWEFPCAHLQTGYANKNWSVFIQVVQYQRHISDQFLLYFMQKKKAKEAMISLPDQ